MTNNLHKQFRAAVKDIISPEPTADDWLSECYYNVDAFEEAFPTEEKRREFVLSIERIDKEVRESTSRLCAWIKQIPAYLRAEELRYEFPDSPA